MCIYRGIQIHSVKPGALSAGCPALFEQGVWQLSRCRAGVEGTAAFQCAPAAARSAPLPENYAIFLPQGRLWPPPAALPSQVLTAPRALSAGEASSGLGCDV